MVPPSGVCRRALPSRLDRIWDSNWASPDTVAGVPPQRTESDGASNSDPFGLRLGQREQLHRGAYQTQSGIDLG